MLACSSSERVRSGVRRTIVAVVVVCNTGMSSVLRLVGVRVAEEIRLPMIVDVAFGDGVQRE